MNRDTIIEVMARAMLADELTVRPTFTFDPTWQQESDIWLSNANAALAALEAAGVRLVPSEATHKMADVGEEARWQSAVRDANNVREIWRAMLAASPYVPQKDESHD